MYPFGPAGPCGGAYAIRPYMFAAPAGAVRRRPEDRVRVCQTFLGRRQLHIVAVELGEVGVGMGDASQRHVLEGVVYRLTENVG